MSFFVSLFVSLPALWPMKRNETFRRDYETKSRPCIQMYSIILVTLIPECSARWDKYGAGAYCSFGYGKIEGL
jgi:hypothetical protein